MRIDLERGEDGGLFIGEIRLKFTTNGVFFDYDGTALLAGHSRLAKCMSELRNILKEHNEAYQHKPSEGFKNN